MGRIADIADLEERLSRPTQRVVEALGGLGGDVLVLGAGGKIGPSLARMARRALDAAGSGATVTAVSRFREAGVEAALQAHGVRTIACDLLEPGVVEALPDAANVVYMAGMKFGATGNEPLLWAMNAWLPGQVVRRYAGSRIVAFSTGNVYGLTPAAGPGSRETDTLQPVGEYAQSCLARERLFEYGSQVSGTPVALLRLNYAVEMRYGVLADLAGSVWRGESVHLAMGWFNCIWQGEANAAALQALGHCASPPLVLNITGPPKLSVREVCGALGELMGREPRFAGEESPDALLSDASKAHALLGPPEVGIEQLLRWTADWTMRDMPTLGKPTHFEEREGRF